jgi:hypothetical protein
MGPNDIIMLVQQMRLHLGISALVEEEVSSTTLAAGNSTLSGTAVPARKFHIITQVSFQYTGTPPTRVTIFATGLGGGVALLSQAAPVSGAWYTASINAILQEGDQITAEVLGATLNDDLVLRYAGYSQPTP